MSKVDVDRAVSNIRYCRVCGKYQGMVVYGFGCCRVCRVCGASEFLKPDEEPFRRYRRKKA